MVQGAVAGLAIGGVYAVIAVLLALMNRLVRVVNFAQGAVGMLGAFTAARLSSDGMSPPAAVVSGLLVGVLASVAVGLVIARWLPEATVGSRSAVTVGVLLFILSISFIVFGTDPMDFRVLVAGSAMSIAGVTISWITVVLVLTAVVVAAAATAVLQYTRTGAVLRAIADRPVAAEMLGLRVWRWSISVWAVSGFVATGALLIAASAQTSDAGTLSMLVIPGAAAALIGGLQRLGAAVVGGLGLGMLEGVVAQQGDLAWVRDWVPLALIVALLMWTQRKQVWDVAR